jgi:hypothetical protein
VCNLLGHLYWDVNDEMVYDGIRSELGDFETFIEHVISNRTSLINPVRLFRHTEERMTSPFRPATGDGCTPISGAPMFCSRSNNPPHHMQQQ